MRGVLFIGACAIASGIGGCHVGFLMVAAGSAIDQGPYRAEAIAGELGVSSVRTLGCLDVGLAVYERDEKELVDVHIGNRCGHPEALDLRKVVIRGLDAEGQPRIVTLHDPRSEVVALHVGGAERGRERLRMVNAHGLASLCFDLEAAAPDAPAARPAPLCFEARNGWKATGGAT